MSDDPLTDALVLAQRDQVSKALSDVASLLGGFRQSLLTERFTETGAEALVLEFASVVWGRQRDD